MCDALNKTVQGAVFGAFSDDLHCAIETGNPEEGRLVLEYAAEAHDKGELTDEQRGELIYDFQHGFPDESTPGTART